ncbi:MAG: hypothetical protein ACKO3T_22095 [Planctomycetaceae bacterium]
METDNPFAVLAEDSRAGELLELRQYGPVGRLRFIGWSVGFAALTLLLFVALLTFAGGLGFIALPLLLVGWYAAHFWLVRARLRNAGFRQWWLLLPPALLFACYTGVVVATSIASNFLADVLGQLTTLLALLNLPLLVICVAIPTAFADRRKSDRAATLLLIAGGTAAVLAATALLWWLFGW